MVYNSMQQLNNLTLIKLIKYIRETVPFWTTELTGYKKIERINCKIIINLLYALKEKSNRRGIKKKKYSKFFDRLLFF